MLFNQLYVISTPYTITFYHHPLHHCQEKLVQSLQILHPHPTVMEMVPRCCRSGHCNCRIRWSKVAQPSCNRTTSHSHLLCSSMRPCLVDCQEQWAGLSQRELDCCLPFSIPTLLAARDCPSIPEPLSRLWSYTAWLQHLLGVTWLSERMTKGRFCWLPFCRQYIATGPGKHICC